MKTFRCESLKKIDEYTRKLLSEQLALCTEKQQRMFEKMYVSVEKIDSVNIPRAFEQIERTIKENEKRKADLVNFINNS